MGLKDLFSTPDHTTEFECQNCGERFEAELSPNKTLSCPDCESEDISRVEGA